jgi:hypothetical protein
MVVSPETIMPSAGFDAAVSVVVPVFPKPASVTEAFGFGAVRLIGAGTTPVTRALSVMIAMSGLPSVCSPPLVPVQLVGVLIERVL